MTSINIKSTEKRKIIVHVHFFKNAGSTVDFILRNNFGGSMIGYEGPHPWSVLQSEEVVHYIIHNSDIKVLTSHQAILLKNEYLFNLKIFTLFFLRHPIDRVGSIYSFKKRLPDNSLRSKTTSLKEFVEWRLSDDGGIVINNFHTLRLSSALEHTKDPRKIRSNDTHLAEAKKTLKDSPFFGLVERFDESIILMREYLNDDFPELNYEYDKLNVSPDRNKDINSRIADIRNELGEPLYKKLLAHNAHDLELYHYGQSLFQNRIKEW